MDRASLAVGIELARRRRDDLIDLIQGNPQRALELALPDFARATLPEPIAAWIEKTVSGRGDLEVLCALPDPAEDVPPPALQRSAILGDTRYQAFVYGRRLGEPTLRGVSLHGIALDDLLAVAESPVRRLEPAAARDLLAEAPATPCALGADHPAASPETVAFEAFGTAALACSEAHLAAYEINLSRPPETRTSADGLALASAATEGTKRLLFIRVDFSDLVGEPFSSNRTAQLVGELDRFYRDNSYGRSGFYALGDGSTVTPVFRLTRTAASYGSANDANGLRTDARNAARAAGYNLAAYDYDLVCFGSVKGFGWAGLGYVGAPGAWIRGTSSAGVVAHELGHNYGLNHANYWDAGGTTTTGAGQSIEYGDKFDTMGAANAGNYHFNARYKRLLNWLQPGEYTVATTNGTYRIYAHDQTNAVDGSRGLQVFANARTNYWLEFRQRFTSNAWLLNGAGLRWTGRGNEASLLLDSTPGTSREKDDAAIVIGRTYSDPIAGLHVTPIAKGGANPAWLDIVVQRGSFADNQPPTLALGAPVLSGSTSTTFEFAADATDPDGDTLAYAWEFGDDTLGTNTPRVTHRWSAAGDYAVVCTVSDLRGGVARRVVAVRVGSPSTARLSGRVTAEGEPVVGALVSAGSGRVTYTDTDGNYLLAGVPRGTVTLSASRGGAPLSPATFGNPLSVTGNRTGLDFTVVDTATTRPVTLLAAGSSWRYWDQGTAPDATWREPGFDDSAWDLGPAILGYGGDKETTVVSFGPDSSRKYITTWFRREFVVTDPGRLSNVSIGLLRDDGAAVYLNGKELFRDNLPSGTLTAQTLASSTISGTEELTYYEHSVDPARLVAGTNLVAVEVHQINATSSDIAMDLRITANEQQILEPGIHLTRPTDGDSFAGPARIVLGAAVGDLAGGTLNHVVFLADGVPVGATTNAPFAVVWSTAAAGDHQVFARAILSDGTIRDSATAVVSVRDAGLAPTFVPRGSRWRYLDTGIAPADAWRNVEFDDATWPEGPARLGYGEDGEFTVVSYGPNASQKHITTWFRHAFDVIDPTTVTQLVCRLQRDDGAAVYLNGKELFRAGLRTGALTPTLLAQSDIQNDAEQTWIERTVDAPELREGRNVVAVEMHQASATSSDLGFDLEVSGRRSSLPATPLLGWQTSGPEIVLSWPAKFGSWRLERTTRLGPDAVWEAVDATPTTTGDRVEVRLETGAAQVFHRLHAP